ncbi:hypothetical protein RHSIM_Rhsim09G0149800 [Rhododendron simsii]|uniref:Sirohydrochlorin ferrochelatase n=1 Tax=Rhododendron simsii TaxID=118357 RepID=A0A834GCP6_RHOSS|nr:hypothetical protein RHSIM_Rhsim09G0149800 [Rhododendron simsii]
MIDPRPLLSSGEPVKVLNSLPSRLNFKRIVGLSCKSQKSVKSETGRSPNCILPRLVKVQKYPTKSRSSSTTCLATRNGGFNQQSHGIGNRDGVIIVDHGSRRKESNLVLDEFVAMFREKTGYPIIEPAHMELAEPSIRVAFGLCVQQGANRVIIVTIMYFDVADHAAEDIPSLTADAAREHPGVSYVITAPLGVHQLLVKVLVLQDVVNDRIKHCLSHVAGVAEECSVCAGTGKCRLY